MWIVDLLPTWGIHTMLTVGLLGMAVSFVLRFIPFVLQYQLMIQITSSVLLAIAFYSEGALSEQEHWKAQVAQAEAKVAEVETAMANMNNNIQYVYVTKTKAVDDAQVALKTKIRKLKKQLDEKCQIDSNAVSILNQSAKQTGDKK